LSQEYFDTLMETVKEAGAISLDLIEDSNPSLKKDFSIITKADMVISELAQKRLEKFLKTSDHILIDEEDPERIRFLDDKIIDSTPYIWSIDPIDGTRLYANKNPNFGISIGLLKDREPWLGAVYFPGLRELFYCDGKGAYFVQNAFSSSENRKKIIPLDQEINSHTMFLADDDIFRVYDWDYKDCQMLILSCAVVDLCWPTIGRACGSLFKSHLWDFAGSWPIFQKAGLKLRSLETGEELNRLESHLFYKDDKPWKVKGFYILSSKRNYSIIKKKLQLRT